MKRQHETANLRRRKRRKWTIEEKILLLDSLKDGVRPCDLCRKYDINESTLRQILANEKQLREYAAICTKESMQSASYVPRNSLIGRTENMVFSWYESEKAHRAAAGTSFTAPEICAKAREIYAELEEEHGRDGDLPNEYERRAFKASKGWFAKFHKHYKLDYKLTQEDAALTEEASKEIELIIDSNNYEPQQIFSATELLLAWRSVPIAPDKAAANDRERVSLLLCANASGDYVVKPLLVHRAIAPLSLRKQRLEDLPFFLRARSRDAQRNPQAAPFHVLEWLKECFIPSVRYYLSIMELPERCVLLLDDKLLSRNSLQEITSEMSKIGFVYIQLVTPMQHPIRGANVLKLFKCVYLKRMLAQLMQIAQQESENFAKVWRNFSIAAAIDVIAETLEECKADWWNSGWLQLWPGIVRKPLDNSAVMEELERVVIVANVLPMRGYDSLSVSDIRKHLRLSVTDAIKKENKEDDDGYDQLLDMGLINEESCDGEEEKICMVETVFIAEDNKLHNDGEASNQVRNINKVLRLSRELLAAVRQVNTTGKERFEEQLHKLLQPYKELKERALQPTIRQFFQADNS